MTFEDALPDLLLLVSEVGALPSVPVEAESFFTRLVEGFSEREALRRHVISARDSWFRSLRERPQWLQEPEWQWEGETPMVFAGSIDAPPGTFHDDARFFVFWSPRTGETKSVIQVA